MITSEPSINGDGNHTSVDFTSTLTTKSIVLPAYGSYDKMRCEFRRYPRPPREGEVIMKVKAVGVNFSDLLLRKGMNPGNIQPPVVVGQEASGDVVEVGPELVEYDVGDRILCVRQIGLWSEYVLVETRHCVLIPESLSYEQASSLPINYVTAYHTLFNYGNLQEGQSVLIHLAAGGVGLAATQLCKTVNNTTVFGIAAVNKHEAIRSNGVDHPIDYYSKDYAADIKNITTDGIDLILDSLTCRDSAKGMSDVLKSEGRLVHYGSASRMSPSTRCYKGIVKTRDDIEQCIEGGRVMNDKTTSGYHIGHVGDTIIQHTLDKIINMYVEGKVKPIIDSVWSFDDVHEALQRVEKRLNIGKVILVPHKESLEPVDTLETVETAESIASDNSR